MGGTEGEPSQRNRLSYVFDHFGGAPERKMESKFADRTLVPVKQPVRSQKGEKPFVFERFWKVPRGGDKLIG